MQYRVSCLWFRGWFDKKILIRDAEICHDMRMYYRTRLPELLAIYRPTMYLLSIRWKYCGQYSHFLILIAWECREDLQQSVIFILHPFIGTKVVHLFISAAKEQEVLSDIAKRSLLDERPEWSDARSRTNHDNRNWAFRKNKRIWGSDSERDQITGCERCKPIGAQASSWFLEPCLVLYNSD